MVGMGWGQCDPTNPKNVRLRSSLLVEVAGKTILFDTSPDLRAQLLAANVTHIDAVIYTHAHADHLHGIDDLRGINRAMSAPIQMYADDTTLVEIKKRFAYALRPLPDDNKTFISNQRLRLMQFMRERLSMSVGCPSRASIRTMDDPELWVSELVVLLIRLIW